MNSRPTTKRTLDDIAAICGLSRMTVSRAFRDAPEVSEETRRMVLEVAKRENYVPRIYRNSSGVTAHRSCYVLFQQDISTMDAFFGDIIIGIQQSLFTSGWVCSFAVIDDYPDFVKLYGMMQSSDPDGVFVVGWMPDDYLNALLEKFTKVVLVDNPGNARLNRPYCSVTCNREWAYSTAMRHLLGHGRRKILLINGPEDHYSSMDYLKGYREALDTHGIAFDPRMVVSGDWHAKGGYAAAKTALEAGVEFDSVFSTDDMACGAMKAIKEAGMIIPRDVAVVGIDGLPIGELVSPALTTVSIDREKMAKLAVEQLMLAQGDQERLCGQVSFFPELVIRESCGDDV